MKENERRQKQPTFRRRNQNAKLIRAIVNLLRARLDYGGFRRPVLRCGRGSSRLRKKGSGPLKMAPGRTENQQLTVLVGG